MKMRITKHNAYRVANGVSNLLHNEYGDVDKVNFTFCGNCEKRITLFVFINPTKAPKISDFTERESRENLIRKFVLNTFEIDCDIFFM